MNYKLFLARFLKRYRRRHMYVTCDCFDNSVTLSKLLYDHIDPLSLDDVKIIVFKVSGYYAFCFNPPVTDTQLTELQVNTKLGCVGFETLVPTVNMIFYDYQIAAPKAKLSVEPHRCTTEISPTGYYYRICKPHHD